MRTLDRWGRGKEAARLVQYCNTYSKKIFHVNICSSCLAIYTSNSAVPNGGSEDERTHLSSPRVPSASERHDNNGLEKDEPFYSTVEELYSACNGKNAEYVDPTTSERPHDLGPLSVEQRVSNIIEVLNTNTSDSPYNYGSNEGNQDQVLLILAWNNLYLTLLRSLMLHRELLRLCRSCFVRKVP